MPFLDEVNDNGVIYRLGGIYQNSVRMEDLSFDIETTGVVNNKKMISQSISSIILTQRTERLFNLSYGTNLYKYLFQVGFSNEELVKSEIKDSILAFETRVMISNNDITVEIDHDQQFMDIEVKYIIKETSEWGTWKDRIYL